MLFKTFCQKNIFLFLGDTPLTDEQTNQILKYGWLSLKETVAFFPEFCGEKIIAEIPEKQPNEKDDFVPFYDFGLGVIHQAWHDQEEILVLNSNENIIEWYNQTKKCYILGDIGVIRNYTRDAQDLFVLITDNSFFEKEALPDSFIPLPLEIINVADYKLLFYLSCIFPTTDSKYRQEQLTLYETKLQMARQKYLMKKQQGKKWVNCCGVLKKADSSKIKKNDITTSVTDLEKYNNFLQLKAEARKNFEEKMLKLYDNYLIGEPDND